MEKKPIKTFEDLYVWTRAIELVQQVYLLTQGDKLSQDLGLCDQLRRASISISTNIAVGFERYSRREYINFLKIAKGSTAAVRSLLKVALEVGYIEQAECEELYNSAVKLSRMLAIQIQALNKSL
ncbi:four helix bundle protein [Aliterella atlantica]|uniref:30S ribosomal protein S23 n=2 Tax=Aliterella TaxID=1827277 RepID=A0A0D8ZWX7_9CYAN|nr:four helix bundle protein [Aliterella atlantica]KJH71716.1 30S ribosomal protein S23 [Aliterella atlantica CENA595]